MQDEQSVPLVTAGGSGAESGTDSRSHEAHTTTRACRGIVLEHIAEDMCALQDDFSSLTAAIPACVKAGFSMFFRSGYLDDSVKDNMCDGIQAVLMMNII